MKIIILLLLFSSSLWAERKITVFVALCDNATQGIVPVGAKIGDGNDASNNLYWGCSDGMKRYFQRSKRWKLKSSENLPADHILETCVFTHSNTETSLTAHAYRGREMKRCLEDFFKATKGAGTNELVAFIGHNGLMDTKPEFPTPAEDDDLSSNSIVLCCLSESWFSTRLEKYNSVPQLLTSQLMYPGSFILHDAIEVWLKDGKRKEYREAAAKAYAKNQKISIKAARGVFADLKD